MQSFKIILVCLSIGLATNIATHTNIMPNLSPLTLGFYTTPETQQPIGLHIKGKIPNWVSGSLYRGAQGSWDSGNYSADHWFDGFSRNHLFEISNGTVKYRSRNASDEIRDFVAETGLYPSGTFGGDPCKVIFGEFETTFRDGIHPVGDKSTDNIGVSYFPDFPGLNSNISTEHGPFVTLVATTDGSVLQQLNPVTLEPIEIFNYEASNQEFIGGGSAAAHPAHGIEGQLYNYILNSTSAEYLIIQIDATGKGGVLATITDAPAAYIHSVFSTEHYVILIVWQCDLGKRTPKPTYNTVGTIKEWDPSRKALFFVVDKKAGGVIAKYTAPAFFAFHQINSYEDPATNSIIIDLPAFNDLDLVTQGFRMPNLRQYVGISNKSSKHDLAGTFRRYRLPNYTNVTRLSNNTIVPQEAIIDWEIHHQLGNIELPRINSAYENKDYQYAYGIHVEKPGYFADSIVKIDTKSRKPKVWTPAVNSVPSEPIFIANPNGTAEDDGVLVTIALDSDRKMSSLVFIDANCMEEIARAE